MFLAVNGKTGDTLWEFSDKMLQTDLMSVYVSQVISDVDGDHVPDILAAHGGDEVSDPAQEEKMFGRIIVFSGKDGTILRYLICSNVHINEISITLQINQRQSCIKNCSTYSWMQAPDRREIYYPPQIIYGLDGDQSVLFGTGGSERSGALYVISMTDLLERDVSRV